VRDVIERWQYQTVQQPTANLGHPAAGLTHADAVAAAWGDVFVAAVGVDGHVYMKRRKDGVWQGWDDAGAPATHPSFGGAPKISVAPWGVLRIAVTGGDGHLWIADRHWLNPNATDIGWTWLDGGTPAGTSIASDPSVDWFTLGSVDVGAFVLDANLPHHRTCGSASGGSAS
jgi:hypothetical protein